MRDPPLEIVEIQSPALELVDRDLSIDHGIDHPRLDADPIVLSNHAGLDQQIGVQPATGSGRRREQTGEVG